MRGRNESTGHFESSFPIYGHPLELYRYLKKLGKFGRSSGRQLSTNILNERKTLSGEDFTFHLDTELTSHSRRMDKIKNVCEVFGLTDGYEKLTEDGEGLLELMNDFERKRVFRELIFKIPSTSHILDLLKHQKRIDKKVVLVEISKCAESHDCYAGEGSYRYHMNWLLVWLDYLRLIHNRRGYISAIDKGKGLEAFL